MIISTHVSFLLTNFLLIHEKLTEKMYRRFEKQFRHPPV